MIGVQIGGKNGKPLLHEIRGLCLSSMAGTRPVGVQVGSKNGKPLLTYAPSLCDDDGKMEVGKTYVGVQIGGKDGKPLLAGVCEVCDGDGYSTPQRITDCYGCERAPTCTLSIYRELDASVICNPPPGSPVNYECSDIFTVDATMTWRTETVDGIEISPANGCEGDEEGYAPCCEGFDGVVCGDYCWPRCEVTRTGYWSDEVVEAMGRYLYCDPDTGVGVCGPMSYRTVRYCLTPGCSDLGDPVWSLEVYFVSDVLYGTPSGWIPNPNPSPCLNVDCQIGTIGTGGATFNVPLNLSFSYLGTVTVTED